MKRFLKLGMASVLAMSVQSVLAEGSAEDHSAHHPEKAVKDTTAMEKDKMMEMKNMTPEQCKEMMSQHHEGMKMDKGMMDGMQHCKMMNEKMQDGDMMKKAAD